MKLKHASHYKKVVAKKQMDRKENLKSIAKHFIDGEVREAIEEVEDNSVNVPVPSEAYGNLNEFRKVCEDILKPLGFTCHVSHDGGGLHNTLFVEWGHA